MSEILISPETRFTPRSIDEVINFFADQAAEPAYKGYSRVAKDLKMELQFIAAAAVSTDEQTRSVDLGLRPLRNGDPYCISGGEPKGTQALISGAYKVTGAEDNVIYFDRDNETGYGQVVLHGHHDNADVYFTEIYDQDGMSWQLATNIPDDLTSRATRRELKPFITTGEQKALWDQLIDELNELPEADIEEAEVARLGLRGYMRQRRRT